MTAQSYNIEVITFQGDFLNDNSHGARFQKLEEFLNRQQLIPSIGFTFETSADIMIDENATIDNYKSPFDYVKVTTVRIYPHDNSVMVIVENDE